MKIRENTDSKISVLKKLAEFIAPYKKNVVIVILALIVASFSILSLGYSLRLLIDNGFVTKDYNHLFGTFTVFVSIIILLSLSSYIRASNVYILSENIEADIRKKVFAHIIKLPVEFFEVNKVSDIIARLTVDTTVINGVITNTLSFITRNFIMFLGGFCFLFAMSIKLTMIVICITPIIAFAIIKISKKMRLYSKKAQEKIALISARIDESLNGIKTVQSFSAENFEIKHFNDTVNEAQKVSKIRYKYRALLAASLISSVLLSIALVLWVGSVDIINNKMSPGELSSFIFYAILVATSITGISDVVGEMSKAASAADRIFELLDIKICDKDLQKKSINPNNIPKIEFKNVAFSYPSRLDIDVLKNISFEIEPGTNIAIVGHSGAGKSTIINLLLRFYSNQKGSILLDGKDIKELEIETLRSFFALVPQESMIFSATALENIKYGNQNASEEEILNAAKDAEIYDFLMSLPDKMDSFVGEKGIRLSGGQRQRIAIARALLKKPKILLLDEATSSLDSENERLVQKALSRLKEGRTTIVIAHRFSTITTADKIILLNKGNVETIGKYDDLMTNNIIFQKLAGEMTK